MSNFIVVGEVAYITLSLGLCATIDASDLHLVSNRNWHVDFIGKVAYAVSREMVNTVVTKFYLHRVIMQPAAGLLVDHRDGDGLNCRRDNLCVATKSQNAMNSRAPRNNSVGLKGVNFIHRLGKYRATIKIAQRSVHLGLFATAEEAHAAYVQSARENFGEFPRSA